MKKFGQSIIILIIAVTVFLTGAGVTIIDYCCSSCGGQTLFMTEQHICCIEDHAVVESESMTCCSIGKLSKDDACENMSFTKDSHCTASRVSADIDVSSFRPHVVIPFVWVSAAFYASPTNALFQKLYNIDDFIDFKSPPDIPPREYLSLIRVLII